MDNSMQIALIQSNLYWNDVEKNLHHFNQLFEKIKPKTAIVVLPEMFSTAFTVNTLQGKRPLGHRALQWMQTQATALQKIVVGSVLFEENRQYFNRLFWVYPDGSFEHYDKVHLFQMGKEHQYITAGTKRVIVTYKGIRFLLQVCYDLRFPVASRNRYDALTNQYDYDVILYVANWPEIRKQAYLKLLQARAIENQAYVIWVNRVGVDHHKQPHTGDTMLLSPTGEILVQAPANEEKTVYADIDWSVLQTVRNHFKVGLDWDSFSLDF